MEFLSLAFGFIGAHADLVEGLASALYGLFKAHAAHKDPTSAEALSILHAGIASAAKTAVDQAAARSSVGLIAESAAVSAVQAAVSRTVTIVAEPAHAVLPPPPPAPPKGVSPSPQADPTLENRDA